MSNTTLESTTGLASANTSVVPDIGGLVCLARQPIYDAEARLFGYELLHRGGDGELSDLQKTSCLLHTAFLDLSIHSIAGEFPVFINFDVECLTMGLAETLPPDRCIIEVLETVQVDDNVRELVRDLRRRGFRVALDDWWPNDHRAALLPDVNFVKLDWPRFTPPTLAATVRQLRQFPVRLLAEKIEHDKDFAIAKSLGIGLYQGYLFARPTQMAGRRIPAWMQSCVQLLQLTGSDDYDIDRCVRLFEQDATLCHKLLKFTNSSANGMRREIHSIRAAVTYLGRKEIRRLVTQVLSVGVSQQPAPEMTEVLLKAKFSELLSERIGGETASGFLAGLLKGLHENLELPLPQLLKDLSVAQPLQEALLSGTGVLGKVLQTVACYDTDDCPAVTPQEGIPLTAVQQAFFEACRWTDELLGSAEVK